MTITTTASIDLPFPTASPDVSVPCTIAPEAWWPQDRWQSDVAKAACRNCPVLVRCFNWALHNEQHGVWGGTTAAEREHLRAQLDLPAPPLFPRMPGARDRSAA